MKIILFSDLHLSPSTFQTCMKVLQRILQEARKLNAKVYMLGDLFDTVYSKGTLPVDMLNALMHFFAHEWDVPTIFFPGNHDYMDAAESEHGLTPFGYCNDLITILDKPTVIDRQLFIPWRRNNETLKTIITEHPDIDVIFAHLDIVGFMLNASKISTEGLKMSDLPTKIPIYTGHYHTPQVIRNIRYLGSPYQLSLSEAEDKKGLVVLNGYKLDHIIPIDYGPHQFKWDLEELKRRHTELRAGDRVSVTVEATENVLHLIAELEVKGINIQIKKPIAPILTRIANNNTLNSMQMLQAYGQRTNVDMDSDSWKTVSQWLQELPTLEENITATDVRPTKLEMQSFGPFKGQLTLALQGQGFTLISGECEQINSSNGAGKSMLAAGAFLWSLTGSIDGRGSLTFGGSVIHTNMPSCTVAISGTVNNVPWKVTRTLSEKKKTTLLLEINGLNVTRSTIGATQKAIAIDIFGLEYSATQLHKYLQNNSIWTQKSSPRWLDASDIAAKAEIAPFAQMKTWLALHEKAKQLQKTNKKNLESTLMQLQMKTTQQKTAKERYIQQKQKQQHWLEQQQQRIVQSTTELQRAEAQFENCNIPVQPITSVNIDQLRSNVNQKRNELATCQARLNNIPDLPEILPEKPVNITKLKAAKERNSSEYHVNIATLRQARQTLRHFNTAGICNTCHRKFDNVDSSLAEQMTEAITNASEKTITSKKVMDQAVIVLATAQKAIQLHEYAQVSLQINKKRSRLAIELQTLNVKLQSTEHFTAAMAQYKTAVMLQQALLQTKLRSQQHLQQVSFETCPFSASEKESINLDSEIVLLNQLRLQQLASTESTAAILAWCGPRGIQTYALDFVVNKLANITTVWLQKLFGISGISMVAYFDEKERLIRQIKSSQNDGILSGGQYQRCQLANFLAFKQLYPNNFPFIVLDEATSSLDVLGVKSVQDVLQEWCGQMQGRTCLFISHDTTQFTETKCYQNFVKISHKRGRSMIETTGENKKRKINKE